LLLHGFDRLELVRSALLIQSSLGTREKHSALRIFSYRAPCVQAKKKAEGRLFSNLADSVGGLGELYPLFLQQMLRLDILQANL
jgi:hypothetical protein